jgi:hypothetical protein
VKEGCGGVARSDSGGGVLGQRWWRAQTAVVARLDRGASDMGGRSEQQGEKETDRWVPRNRNSRIKK